MRFSKKPAGKEEGGPRDEGTDRILRHKVLAFSLVSTTALGAVFKEQSALGGGLFLDGFLTACLALGVFFWISSKRMEWRGRRNTEDNNP